MDILEILVGQLPEALYFALFMIYTKRLDKKRVLFCVIMVLEYLLLLNLFPFSIWSHVLYFMLAYILMKVMYKEKTRITDVFTMGIASVGMMIVNLFSYFAFIYATNSYVITCVLNRLVLFDLLFLFKDKLYLIQVIYNKLWNRNDKIPKPMKSITFRCLNLTVLNIMFYLINLCMLCCMWYNSR